jgi:hypothetical protein
VNGVTQAVVFSALSARPAGEQPCTRIGSLRLIATVPPSSHARRTVAFLTGDLDVTMWLDQNENLTEGTTTSDGRTLNVIRDTDA